MVLLDLDPNVVKPGWIPLVITIVLAGVIALLYVSMRRQFRRIDVTRSQAGSQVRTGDAEAPTSVAPGADQVGVDAAAPPSGAPVDDASRAVDRSV